MRLAVLIVFAALAGCACVMVTAGVRTVPAGKVGIIYKRFGPRPPEDDSRVSAFGAAGPQAQILRGNGWYWRPPLLYRVRRVRQTHVPDGTIGVVIAKAGAIRSSGDSLAKHVECNHFRDGVAFLKNGGEQGRQQQILASGYYDINTELFEVITVQTPEAARRAKLRPGALRVIEIPIGETGVVITHVGAKPETQNSVGKVVEGHSNFLEPWRFLEGGGWKGVQEETFAEGGHYELNPWFAHVVRIPTRVLILEWTKEEKSDSNFDIALKQIRLDVQAHTVRLDMKQTVQIPPKAAPRLVCRFGDGDYTDGRAPVRQFVEKELAATVTGYFRKISGKYRIQEFITKYDEVCNELAAEVRQALLRTNVIAIETILEEFECDEQEINDTRRRIAVQQETVKLERARLEELKARRDNEKVLSEIKLQQAKVEEAFRKLDHIKIQVLVEQLGPQHVARERIVEQLVKANVPQVIGGASGDIADAMLNAMPFIQARDLLLAMFNESGKNAVTAGSQQAGIDSRREDGPAELTESSDAVEDFSFDHVDHGEPPAA